MGAVLSQMPGRQSEAISHFEAALRIRPDYPDAHFNLGMALANAGRYTEAIQHLEAAQRLKPDPEVQRVLDQVRAASR
jgi:tetratricopeptide (TPR) repeat protein